MGHFHKLLPASPASPSPSAAVKPTVQGPAGEVSSEVDSLSNMELGYPDAAFNHVLEEGTGLVLPSPGLDGRSDVSQRRVRRLPGGLLRDPVGGNVRMTGYKLGHGACGEVVLCFNERTRRAMAVKKARIDKIDPELLVHEARAYLRGRSIIAPLAVLFGPQKTYMLQALCPGNIQTVVDVLASDNRHAARLGLALLAGRQALAALDALHDEGYGHRDVKPSNLLFVNDEIILADYDRVGRQDAPSLMPTLWYAPPEAFALTPGHDTRKVDIWSLGVTLLEIGCGFDERIFPLRQRVAEHLLAPLQAQTLPRGGAFDACYARCLSRDDYDDPLIMLTQAVLVRAMTLVHDGLLLGQAPPARLPSPPVADAPGPLAATFRDVPADDPIRLIPDALRIEVQACFIRAMQDLPLPLRTLVRRMLEPEAHLRPAAKMLQKQLNLTLLDGVCHPERGKRLLQQASRLIGEHMREALLPEVYPSLWKRLQRLITR